MYNRYKTGVYNYVLRMVNDKMLCEDIVQNVFMKFFENYKNIRNKESSKYWIYTTVRNEIFTYFRTKKSRADQFNVLDTDELEITSEINVENIYEQNEIRNHIMNILEKLPFAQREVYLLKEYGELSYREISHVMNIDEELVKSRLFKTRQKLITQISKLIKEE